jgi:hypothetical protein
MRYWILWFNLCFIFFLIDSSRSFAAVFLYMINFTFVWDSNLFVAILADDKLLVISIVEYKTKMGTEMKDSVKCFFLIWGRCNLKRSRRTVIFFPVYKISTLKITPPKTPNPGQFSYPLPNIVSFLFGKKSTRVPV